VDGERGDIYGLDNSPDRELGPKLFAAVFEFIAEE
jgi:hypothetical protein